MPNEVLPLITEAEYPDFQAESGCFPAPTMAGAGFVRPSGDGGERRTGLTLPTYRSR
jgi:hypothetical protein